MVGLRFGAWQVSTPRSVNGADEQETLEGKLRTNGRISMWLALVSLALMAGARYIGPVLSM